MPVNSPYNAGMLIATHSGKFHADDVWGVATLDLLFPGSTILRSRDSALLANADFVVDVGGEWDPERGRFDHHQKGFAQARANGVVYASAGLVWKAHGAACVATVAKQLGPHALPPQSAQEMAWAIDADLVQYLDMSDTGAARSAPGSYGLSAVISGFNPNWLDEQAALAGSAGEEAGKRGDDLRLRAFLRAVEFMREIIINAVKYRLGGMLAASKVRTGQRLEEGRLLVLEQAGWPWATIVRIEMPLVLFVVAHAETEGRYILSTVPAETNSFRARKDLPASWAGLRGADLARVTGVADADFCHNGRFIAAARSYDGIMDMARQALAE